MPKQLTTTEPRTLSENVQIDESFGYTQLFRDFLAGSPKAKQFFASHDLPKVCKAIDQTEYQRERMTDILIRQNRAFGTSQKVLKNIERLRNPQAVTLFCGQQAGLMSGPLLTLIKAIGVVKAARLYEAQLGRPVIPIFWIAADDHDFAEINHIWLLNRQSEPVRVGYDAPPTIELPASEILLENAEELEKMKQAMRDVLGESDFTIDLYDLVNTAYAPSETLVTSFAKFMARLTQETELAYFSPGDDDVKDVAKPFFLSLIDKRDEVRNTIKGTNEKLVQSGYHRQVEKDEANCHLFYHEGGRKPIVRGGDDFIAGDQRFTLTELTDKINEHPALFSTDVMSRAILQSFLFPVVSQKGGPSEIAYLAQVNPLFALFDLPTPVYRHRPSATLVERRIASMMQEYDIKFADMSGDKEQIVNRVLHATFPDDIGRLFERFREDLKTRFEVFSQKSLAFDPSMEESAKQTQGKIDFALGAFESKLFAAHKKRSKETRERIYRIANSLYPNRNFQERSINISYFIAKYGLGVVSLIVDNLDSEEAKHQLIYIP